MYHFSIIKMKINQIYLISGEHTSDSATDDANIESQTIHFYMVVSYNYNLYDDNRDNYWKRNYGS